MGNLSELMKDGGEGDDSFSVITCICISFIFRLHSTSRRLDTALDHVTVSTARQSVSAKLLLMSFRGVALCPLAPQIHCTVIS